MLRSRLGLDFSILTAALIVILILFGDAAAPAVYAAEHLSIPAESPSAAKLRHGRVAERRKRVNIICHRGASEFAHENTLEAYRATFELGGDGNEFDPRITKDGVLVCFHDDMLDRLLEAYGDVSDYTWEELQRFAFREPGRFGAQCRIPTLVEVFELHRKYAGLMHLDIKRKGLDKPIADLLTQMDMWDQVAYCNMDNGGVILQDPRLKLRRYKSNGLYQDRSDVFPDKVTRGLARDGDDLIVDDPRMAAHVLHRHIGAVSNEPVSPIQRTIATTSLPEEQKLISVLRDADDWDRIPATASEKSAKAARIVARAAAADQLAHFQAPSKAAVAALVERARNRSLHPDWRYHGLDGAMALRALIVLRAPQAVDTARLVLWRDDPSLAPLAGSEIPRTLMDFRQKSYVFPALKHLPGAATEQLCRDYLALSEKDAQRFGPPAFEDAAKALLTISPSEKTAIELMRDRRQVVRGRAVLECLSHSHEAWARAALEKAAPFALELVPATKSKSVHKANTNASSTRRHDRALDAVHSLAMYGEATARSSCCYPNLLTRVGRAPDGSSNSLAQRP